MAAIVHFMQRMENQVTTTERRVVADRRRRYSAAGSDERRMVERRAPQLSGAKLSLAAVRQMADVVTQALDERLAVVGILGSSSSSYVEILVAIRGCDAEPCRVTVGVNRLASLEEMRTAIKGPLAAYLRRHTRKAS